MGLNDYKEMRSERVKKRLLAWATKAFIKMQK